MSSTPAHTFVPSDEIRARFSSAMSEMYRDEVPQYGTLIELVADINQRTLQAEPELLARMQRSGELARLVGAGLCGGVLDLAGLLCLVCRAGA